MFVTELVFPADYPLSPPKMKFVSNMFHPNGSESMKPCSCGKHNSLALPDNPCFNGFGFIFGYYTCTCVYLL